MDFSAVGVRPDRMMTPAPDVEKEKWACVACDQYTSQPEYWQETSRIVGGAPSCLHMILPECFLGEAETRIPQIHRTMADYCRNGVLRTAEAPGMMNPRKEAGPLGTADLPAPEAVPEEILMRDRQVWMVFRQH